MKTLKSIMLGLALLIISGVAQAAKPAPVKLSKSDVVNLYVDASIHGKLTGLANAISEDVVFNIVRGANTITANKKQLLNYFKSSENIEQKCEVKTTTVAEDDDATTIKLEMKYENSTRVSLISLNNTYEGWKITKVEQSVK
jgi:hypothetical protein